MDFSCHGEPLRNPKQKDDATCDMSLSSMLSDTAEEDEGSSFELNNRSLDWDRHISTQRPTRDVVLREVRGEDSDNDLGESFAIDDSHPVQPPRMGRGESSLVPVPDTEFSDSQSDIDTDQNETSEPILTSDSAAEEQG